MIFDKNITVICHTNSECLDIFSIFIDRFNKYSVYKNLLVLCDVEIPNIKTKLYQNSDTYKDRLSSTLKYIDSEYVLLLHEDFILYDHCLEVDVPDNVDYVRLQKNGINSNELLSDNVYKICHGDITFSITPCIWKTCVLIDILKKSTENTIWGLEKENQYQYLNEYVGCYVFEGESKRGMYHHNSKTFPCILSAINKGKWNYSEYTNEILLLSSEYGVNLNVRGCV